MKNILVCDSSLKTLCGEGAFAPSFRQKLEIAKRLSELCVDVIEVCSLSGDKSEDIFVKTVCNCVQKSVISCVAGKTAEEIEKNYSLISGAKHKRLNVEMPVSPVQMEYLVSQKPAIVLETLKTLTQKAVSLCEDVEVTLTDATRAESDFLFSTIKTAISCGAKTVTLSDVAGTIVPQEFAEFIKDVRKNVPELNGVTLFVAVSDVFALGTANSLSAILAGADGVKTSSVKTDTLPPIEKISGVLENVAAKKGYSNNLNKTAIKRIVASIAESSKGGKEIATEKADRQDSEIVTKTLTQAALGKLIRKRGYDLSAEDVKKVYAEFTRLSEKKQVSAGELDVIIATNAMQVPETYSLISFSVNSSNVVSATASIVLEKDGEKISGLSYGNGPVDAAFLAIESIVGRHFELDEFQLGAVTEGKEAMGQTVVKLRYNGVIYSGRGVSTDVIGASIRAYVNAVNKIVYEER